MTRVFFSNTAFEMSRTEYLQNVWTSGRSCTDGVCHPTWTRCPRTYPLVRIPANWMQTCGRSDLRHVDSDTSNQLKSPSRANLLPLRSYSPLLCISLFSSDAISAHFRPPHRHCQVSATPTHTPARVGLRQHPPRIRPQSSTLCPC